MSKFAVVVDNVLIDKYVNDELYESLVDSNVYTPDQYSPNWSKQ